MPSHFGPDPGDDSDDEQLLRRDEYGELFEDYGFVKRAEDFKTAGNEEFKKERYEKALREYDNALDQLVTVAYDKSITIGKKKWNDIVICRSTLHLNKSTCYFKMKNWQKSLDEALQCLVGNVRDEMMFTDPLIRNKVKQEEQKTGSLSMLLVEDRLPKSTRSKAWFRVSKCYAQLKFLDRAKEALDKSLEVADADQQLILDIAQHAVHIEALERDEKNKQKRQFRGFFDKLQDRGGYAEGRNKKPESWDRLNYSEKYREVGEEEYEGYCGEARYYGGFAQRPDPDDILGVQRDYEDKIIRTMPPGVNMEVAIKHYEKAKVSKIDKSFQQYLEHKGQDEEDYGASQGMAPPLVDEFGHPLSPGFEPNMAGLPPPPKESVPPRPRRKDETPLRWDSGKRPGSYARVRSFSPRRAARSKSPGAGRFDPAEVWSRRLEEGAEREAEWRYQFEQQQIDEQEEEELRKARERMEKQRRERVNKQKKVWLEALDDSTDDERPQLK